MVVNLLHCSRDKRNTHTVISSSAHQKGGISQPSNSPLCYFSRRKQIQPLKLVAGPLAFKYLLWSCTGDWLIYDPIGSFTAFEDHSGHVRGVTRDFAEKEAEVSCFQQQRSVSAASVGFSSKRSDSAANVGFSSNVAFGVVLWSPKRACNRRRGEINAQFVKWMEDVCYYLEVIKWIMVLPR